MLTLEKIDQVVERTGVTYEEARNALNQCDGDVIDAIIYLENSQTGFAEKFSSNINETKNAVMDTLKDLLKKGNITRVVVRNEEKVVLNIPIYAGVIGVMWQPYIALIAATIATLSKYNIIIQTNDEKEYNLNEMTEEGIKNLKEKVDSGEISRKFHEIKRDLSKEAREAKKHAEEVIVDIEEKADEVETEVKEAKDHVVAEVEEKAEEVKDKVEETVEEVKDKMEE